MPAIRLSSQRAEGAEPGRTQREKRRTKCPLCGGENAKLASQLSGAQLRRLWKELGKEFSPEAWGRIHEGFVVELHKCQSCGFAFFEPGLAGNASFYSQVVHEGYYCPDRPEFSRTLRFAHKAGLKKVLDVGCGSGAFLDLARKAGRDTYGLELNQAEAETARGKGHKVFNRLLHELNLAEAQGGFDLITLFQVLEHLDDPVQILRQAAALLNADGCIAVAVPSEQGAPRLVPWDPAQWPPHHVSRWRLADLERLGRAAQLRVIEKGGDMLLGGFRQSWEIHNRLAPVVGMPGRMGSGWLLDLVGLIYRKTGMKFIFPRPGSSIYAYFQAR